MDAINQLLAEVRESTVKMRPGKRSMIMRRGSK